MSDESLAGALTMIRSSRTPGAESRSWARVDAALRRRGHALRAADRDEVHQRSLLKVLRGIGAFEGQHDGAAEAWLRAIHRSAVSEHFRARGAPQLAAALREQGGEPMDTLPALEETSFRDPRVLDEVLERVLDRVQCFVEETVTRPSKRVGDVRRAQVALLSNVRGLSNDELRQAAHLDATRPTDGALSKWVERGRETVLLPALEGWEDPIAEPLAELLRSVRRADAGKARPGRRSVSSEPSAASGPVNRTHED